MTTTLYAINSIGGALAAVRVWLQSQSPHCNDLKVIAAICAVVSVIFTALLIRNALRKRRANNCWSPKRTPYRDPKAAAEAEPCEETAPADAVSETKERIA